jgi:amino acid adenylation domain-containing protein
MNPNDFTERLAKLSPAKLTLLELRLQQKAAADSVRHTIARSTTRASAPLSFAQQRLWFLNQLEPASPICNESRAIRLRGSLDVESLQKSLDRIVARHDVLRTNFITLDGNPQQTITDRRAVELPVIDLRSCRGIDRESEAHRLLTDVIRRPFDLSRDLLLRVLLLRLAEQEHILLFVQHHIASDGWSTSIFWHELTALYEAFTSGRPDPLSELPIQYADYALWQRDRLSGETLEGQLAYWRKQLENLAPLQLTPDRARPGAHDYAGDRQTFLIPQEVTDGLRRLSRDEGVTLFMTLLAGFQTLLHRYTGQNDIAVGSPIAGRTHPEVEGLIGFFVNTLVLRTEVSGHLTFRQFLARVREVAWGAYQHQELPFEKLVAELQPDRNLGRNPLFQVIFAFQNVPRQTMALPGLEVSQVEVDSGTAKFDLALFMWEEHGGLRGRVQYSTALFDADTIERLLGHFETMLIGIVTNPDRRLSHLPLLTEREKHQILVEWNNTATVYPNDACIHELFEEQVKKSPDAIAVVLEDQQLTYRELNRRANQLAHYLRKLGVGPEVLVGICMDRSLEMIIGLLGILKAGGAYVPLDPEYPKERLRFMLEDTQAPVLLTQERLIEDRGSRLVLNEAEEIDNLYPLSLFLGPRIKAVCLDRDWEEINKESDQNLDSCVTANNLAYVIYTSGSTGKPKGVAIHHGSTAALLSWAHTVFSTKEMAGVLASTSICFDLSVFELFAPLCCSGHVILAQNALALPTLPAASQVTLINTVPSAMAELLRVNGIPSLVCTINLAGEPLKANLVREIYQRNSATKVYDLYGPSEDTTYSTCALRAPTGPQTIGKPISNTQVYALDQQMQPVPVGVPGELYIGGAGLARGYLYSAELTAEKFIPNPFSNEPGARLYRTGDLGRYLADGNIEFLGRIDHQVKIRGYRVELGEIEAVLGQHPAVCETVVVVREDDFGDASAPLKTGHQLVAYIANKGPAPHSDELRNLLRQKLPGYMVPSAFVFLDSLPLAPNGKVDRKNLPAPDHSRPELQASYQAPCTPAEEMLVEIWAEVLKLESIGVHDNFFDLGGHSLLATQVISRIRGSFQVEVPLRALFESPTIAGLAERIEAVRREERGLIALPVVSAPRKSALPLSFAQERLWFLDQLEPGSSVYNMSGAFRVSGRLDAAALERSLNEIVRRHETLRTTFRSVEGVPRQVIAAQLILPLPVIDLSDGSDGAREEQARRCAAEAAPRPFDLSDGPLVRATLLRLGEEEHILLLGMHHIVSDSWSMVIFFRELSILYEAYANGKASPLPELPIQYVDYAVWRVTGY